MCSLPVKPESQFWLVGIEMVGGNASDCLDVSGVIIEHIFVESYRLGEVMESFVNSGKGLYTSNYNIITVPMENGFF